MVACEVCGLRDPSSGVIRGLLRTVVQTNETVTKKGDCILGCLDGTFPEGG